MLPFHLGFRGSRERQAEVGGESAVATATPRLTMGHGGKDDILPTGTDIKWGGSTSHVWINTTAQGCHTGPPEDSRGAARTPARPPITLHARTRQGGVTVPSEVQHVRNLAMLGVISPSAINGGSTSGAYSIA